MLLYLIIRCVLKVACTCEFLALSECPERSRGGDTITSLVRVSFYDLSLVRPVFPGSRATCGRRVHGVRRPMTVNDQKIRAIVEEESLLTMARSIGVNGCLTTRRPTFSPSRCVPSLLQNHLYYYCSGPSRKCQTFEQIFNSQNLKIKMLIFPLHIQFTSRKLN